MRQCYLLTCGAKQRSFKMIVRWAIETNDLEETEEGLAISQKTFRAIFESQKPDWTLEPDAFGIEFIPLLSQDSEELLKLLN